MTTTMRRSASLVGVFALLLAAFAPATIATADEHVTDEITFCHATGSPENPYELITTDPATFFLQGHDGHVGAIFDPATMGSGDTWGDIVPAFQYEVEAEGETTIETFEGMNWGEAGQAILANECVMDLAGDPTDATVALTLAKDWTGDALDVTPDVTFTIDGTDHAVGAELSVDPGTTVTVSETVSGLPEGCSYVAADLEHTTAAFEDWTESEQQSGVRAETLTVTNDVTCEEVVDQPELTVVKEALDTDNGTVTLVDGSAEVTYRYTITNTGNVAVTLTGLTDDRIAALAPDALDLTVLAPGATATAQITTTLTEADFDGEGDTHTNLATVTAITDAGIEITVDAQETISFVIDGVVDQPELTVVKEALDTDNGTVTLVDGSAEVTYRYTITNTGNVAVTLTGLTDDRIAALAPDALDLTVLAPGATATAQITTTLTEADFDGEGDTHTNLATVTAITDAGIEITVDAQETIGFTVPDAVIVVPTPDDGAAPIISAPQPDTTAPTAPAPRPVTALPVTGSDGLLGMVLAALAALGLGAGLLRSRPAAQRPAMNRRRR
jgi:hypothetical protein